MFLFLRILKNIIVVLILAIIVVALLFYIVYSNFANDDIPFNNLHVSGLLRKPRFRKRDKVAYYANRFGHKFNEITGRMKGIKSPEERQRTMSEFAKGMFGLSKDRSGHVQRRKILPSYFEPELDDDDSSLPEDMKLLMASIRVFGHLEKDLFLELYASREEIEVAMDEYLYKIGDPDVYFYVVKSGKMRITILKDGTETSIYEVEKGGNLHSILSTMNVLTGHPGVFKTVQAQAMEDSQVLRVPVSRINAICPSNSSVLMRILQIISVRLHNVALTALHNYFGLSAELIQQCSEMDTQYKHLLRIVSQPAIESLFRNGASATPSPQKGRGKESKKQSLDLLSIGEALCDSPSTDDETELASETPGSEYIEWRESAKWRSIGDAACAYLSKFLTLGDAAQSCLTNSLTLTAYQPGAVVAPVGEIQRGMYLVLGGEISAMQPVPKTNPLKMSHMFSVGPGCLAGVIGLVTGEPTIYSLRSVSHCLVAMIPRDQFYAIARHSPEALLTTCEYMASRMSPLLRQIDFALEWMTVRAGKALYKQGELSHNIYIVLNGRLRQIATDEYGKNARMVSECGRGDLVGFLEVFGGQRRASTVMAIRDSELARIPILLLNWLRGQTPQIINQLIQLLSEKMLGSLRADESRSETAFISLAGSMMAKSLASQDPGISQAAGAAPAPAQSLDSSSTIPIHQLGQLSNLRAVAILPGSPEVNAEAFSLELQHALSPYGSSVRLTSEIVQKRMGTNGFQSLNEFRLSSWLNHLEDRHRIVFYVCDGNRSSMWTRRCIRQTDCVLVLHLADSQYADRPTAVETALDNDPTKVTKVLILMHRQEKDYPQIGRTAVWLNSRPWVCQHYHIRCPSRVMLNCPQESLINFYSYVFAREKPNPMDDMSRLARYLTGKAIGVVLGGGGARGAAHVGVLRVFQVSALFLIWISRPLCELLKQEAGIPIDMIGGTSIGSFMGALWAEETRVANFIPRAQEFCSCFTSVWAKLKDLTCPSVSIFSGREFNAQLRKVFLDRQIEDLWIPFFCVTSDITHCKMRVHTQGSLWRYVRSSMSLAGYIPPLCDPYDGAMLLDGGYINNLPADLMSSFGVKTIFAVDVGAAVETNLTNYGDWISGWWVLYKSWFAFRSPIRVPNIIEIQSRLAYISCVKHLEQVKRSGICHYLRPPIDAYMTLQFSAFTEIMNVGYQHAKQILLDWIHDGKIKQILPHIRLSVDGLFRRRSMSLNSVRQTEDEAFTRTASDVDESEVNMASLRAAVQLVEQECHLISQASSLSGPVAFVDLADEINKFGGPETGQTTPVLPGEKTASLPEFVFPEEADSYETSFKREWQFNNDTDMNINADDLSRLPVSIKDKELSNESSGYEEDVEDLELMTASDPEFHKDWGTLPQYHLNRYGSLTRLNKPGMSIPGRAPPSTAKKTIQPDGSPSDSRQDPWHSQPMRQNSTDGQKRRRRRHRRSLDRVRQHRGMLSKSKESLDKIKSTKTARRTITRLIQRIRGRQDSHEKE